MPDHPSPETKDSSTEPTPTRQQESSNDDEPKKQRERPLNHPWQRRWLDLEVHHPDIQTLADIAQEFAFAWFQHKNPKRVTIVGEVGCGKTHVSKAIAFWAQRSAYDRWFKGSKATYELPRVEFVKASRMLSPETYPSDSFETRLEAICGSAMAILDDIGTETDQYRTGIPAARLARILDACQERHLWITTNKLPSAWNQTWDRRVEDRLLAGRVIEIRAPSFRSEV
jgi:DNA replication protein DnaC